MAKFVVSNPVLPTNPAWAEAARKKGLRLSLIQPVVFQGRIALFAGTELITVLTGHQQFNVLDDDGMWLIQPEPEPEPEQPAK